MIEYSFIISLLKVHYKTKWYAFCPLCIDLTNPTLPSDAYLPRSNSRSLRRLFTSSATRLFCVGRTFSLKPHRLLLDSSTVCLVPASEVEGSQPIAQPQCPQLIQTVKILLAICWRGKYSDIYVSGSNWMT